MENKNIQTDILLKSVFNRVIPVRTRKSFIPFFLLVLHTMKRNFDILL